MPITCIPGNVLCGLGLPEILLWVLVFAIVYGILNMLNIFGKADASGKKHPASKIHALIALVVAFFVLMSVPLSVIALITSMSNSFVVLAMTLIVVIALLQIAVNKNYLAEGTTWPKYVAIALIIVMALVFVGAGGLAFIGLSTLPAVGISLDTIVLAVIAIAVLWLIFS